MADLTIAAAEATLRALLRDDPANPLAIHDLGILAHRDHRLSEALHLLKQALALAPDNVAILKSCAQIQREAGEPEQAAVLFERALDLDPTDALAWNAAGVCLQESDQPARALEAYLRALSLAPDNADVYYNIGNLLLAEKDFPSAIDQFRHTVALNANHTQAHTHLAIARRHQFEYTAAVAHFQRAHELDPNSADLAMGFGEVLSLIYDQRSEATLRNAVLLDPTRAEIHWNLALDLLKRGNYTEGLREYEWRWQRGNGHNTPRSFTQTFWLGEDDISRQTLLVHAEQGFGDTVQMLRYVPLLRERAQHLIVEVQPELHRLVSSLPGITAIARGDTLPHFDTHIAMMSLPLALRTTLETIPPPLRFPVAEPAPRNHAKRRIGLCWSGNPHHDRDRERSIPIALFDALLAIPEMKWVSLQPTSAPSLEQHTLNDFLDTAMLMQTLDLVITVDSAVAHLALSQGLPTVLLLPFVADWRWLAPHHATPNPWYPQAHILRQSTPSSGWALVIERLRIMLTDGSLPNP